MLIIQYSPARPENKRLPGGSALNPPRQNFELRKKTSEGKNNFQPLLFVFSNYVPQEGVNNIPPWVTSFKSESAKWSFFNALFQGSIVFYTSYQDQCCPQPRWLVLIYNNQYLIKIIHQLWQTNRCESFRPTRTSAVTQCHIRSSCQEGQLPRLTFSRLLQRTDNQRSFSERSQWFTDILEHSLVNISCLLTSKGSVRTFSIFCKTQILLFALLRLWRGSLKKNKHSLPFMSFARFPLMVCVLPQMGKYYLKKPTGSCLIVRVGKVRNEDMKLLFFYSWENCLLTHE